MGDGGGPQGAHNPSLLSGGGVGWGRLGGFVSVWRTGVEVGKMFTPLRRGMSLPIFTAVADNECGPAYRALSLPRGVRLPPGLLPQLPP